MSRPMSQPISTSDADVGREMAPPGAAVRLLVRGHVQGIGFRPFVYRLARQSRLGGRVCNMSAGVVIELEGPPDAVDRFRERLVSEAPSAAKIDEVLVEP